MGVRVGHASSPCLIAARTRALLLLLVVLDSDTAVCFPNPIGEPVPADSGLRVEGVGREASWLTTLRSYGVTGRSGEDSGGLRALELVLTCSIAAASMGAAEPEPS